MSALPLTLPRPQPAKVASADDWFFALDQRRIGAGAKAWVAQVFGVYRQNGELWVQLAPLDRPASAIVVHVSPATRLDDVLDALEHRHPTGEGKPEVIDLVGRATEPEQN
jgi:hypothetical protein